jgi:hypothetical protein
MPQGKKRVSPSTVNTITNQDTIDISSESVSKNESVKIQTKEQIERITEPVMEKSKHVEKDTAPVVLVSWTDTNGKRHTVTYTCAEVRIHQDRSEILARSGKKTTLSMSLEAQVLEVDMRS